MQNQHVSFFPRVRAGGCQPSQPSSPSSTASCFHFFACLGGVSSESSPCMSSRRRLGGLPSASAPKRWFSLPSSSSEAVVGTFVGTVVGATVVIAGFAVIPSRMLLLVVVIAISEASCREDSSPTVASPECKLRVLSPLLVLAARTPLARLDLLFFGRFGESRNGFPFLTAHSISIILLKEVARRRIANKWSVFRHAGCRRRASG